MDQTYNKSGAYSDTLSKLFGSTVDEKWVISSKIKIRSRTKTRIKRKIRVLIKLLKSKTDKKAMRKIEFALITMA